MRQKIFTIIDGYGFLFRAYYVLHHLTTTANIPIGAVYGFLRMVLKYTSNSDYLAIAFDSGKRNFRHNLYSKYKANRVTPPDSLVTQFNILREATEAFNLRYEEIEGYEADDIIATLSVKYSKLQDFKVIVVSADKDLFQLLKYGVRIYDPIKNIFIDEKQIMEKFGVNSNKLLDLFSLTGDTSDNIPGVPGIGQKTAAKLLNEFGSLDGIIENINNVKQKRVHNILVEHKEKALISRELFSLCRSIDFEKDITKYEVHPPNLKKLLFFLRKYEFYSLILEVEKLYLHGKSTLKEQKEYNSKELEKFLEHCRYEGKIAIYCHIENKVINKISLSCNEDNIFYVDQNHLENSLSEINSILSLNGVLKIIHDSRCIKKIFPRIESVLDSVNDLMIMSYSLDTRKHDHSILNIVAHNFSESIDTISSKTLISIYKKLTQRLSQERLFTTYERFDRPVTKVIFGLEKNGISVDSKKLEELSSKFQQLITILENDIYNISRGKDNVHLQEQLSFDFLRKKELNEKKKSKFNPCASQVLEPFEEEGKEVAIESKVLSFLYLSKLMHIYADALIKHVYLFDNRLHTNFSITSSITEKPSSNNDTIKSKEFNLIKQTFIAPKGYRVISANYSQVELRLLAHFAEVSAFKASFMKGEDIYENIARKVFRVQEIDKRLRYKAKAINFGILHGISIFCLAKRLEISIQEAHEHINYYFSCYPEIKVYMEKAISIARRHNYVEALFGRRYFISDIKNKIPCLRQFVERAATSIKLQVIASDITKLAMIHIFDQLKTGKIILQASNELLIEVEENSVQEVAKLVKDIMESAIRISVPLEVEVKAGNIWNTDHKLNILSFKRVVI